MEIFALILELAISKLLKIADVFDEYSMSMIESIIDPHVKQYNSHKSQISDYQNQGSRLFEFGYFPDCVEHKQLKFDETFIKSLFKTNKCLLLHCVIQTLLWFSNKFGLEYFFRNSPGNYYENTLSMSIFIKDA